MIVLNRDIFITILKDNYPRYYKTLISHNNNNTNNIVLCVPVIEISEITKQFIESHILKICVQNNRYISYNGLIFNKIENCLVNELDDEQTFSVEILSSYLFCDEYDNSFHIFTLNNVLVPMEPEFNLKDIENVKIQQLNDASLFLKKYNKIGEKFLDDIDILTVSHLNAEGMIHEIQNIVKEKWSCVLYLQHEEMQQNAYFQWCLTVSLENVIVEKLHDKIMHVFHNEFEDIDVMYFSKCKKLSKVDITPDQLGIPKEFVTPLPAAIVELATLDTKRSPLEKLNCLQTTYDLILAELKGGIIELIAEITDIEIPTITNEIITLLFMYVIIKSKPVHLISNCYFINNLQHTLTPNNVLSTILQIFQQAVEKLKHFNIKELNPRSSQLLPNIGLGDLIQITSEIHARFDRNGRRIYKISSPTDLYLERLTSMISAATLKNS